MYLHGYAGIKYLNSQEGTLNDKFLSNSLIASNVGFHIVVALRNARVNHACQPNASTIFDETARVAILFAQKDIQPGEEITICYYSGFFSLLPNVRTFPA